MRVCGSCNGELDSRLDYRRRFCDNCLSVRRAERARSLNKKRNPLIYDVAVRDYILSNYKPHVAGSQAEVARKTGLPATTVRRIAIQLGIPGAANQHFKHGFTPSEDDYILENAYFKSWGDIAKHLGGKRSPLSIAFRAKRLGASAEYRDYYNADDVAKVLGVHQTTAKRLMSDGLIKSQVLPVGSGTGRYTYRTTEGEIIRFMFENPLSFKLARVDQAWFMDCITRGGITKKILAAAAKEQKLEELNYDRARNRTS